MPSPARLFQSFVASIAAIVFALAAAAQEPAPLDRLFERLQRAEAGEAQRIEREIWTEWSKSGSPAMDLLLRRGRDAIEAGDLPAAIEHLTALTDSAPDFAEGWNARATAYFQAGLFGPSVADIARTLELNPRHFGALTGFGMILEATDRKAQALEVYRAALAIHPHLEGVLQAVERLTAEMAGQNL